MSFSEDLEKQVRLEVREILNNLPVKTELVGGQWVVTVDVTEAENKLTELALSMY